MIKPIFFILFFISITVQASFLPDQFHASYVEVTKSLRGKEKLSPERTISYLYPGHIRIDSLPNFIIVVNPQKIWRYTPAFNPKEQGEVRIFKTESNVFVKFFDALKAGLIDNNLYKVSVLNEKAELSFKEDVIKQIGIVMAQLVFNNPITLQETKFKDLKTMNLTYEDGKVVVLKFNKVDDQKKISKADFIFDIPQNTKEIEEK
jgi:outer membrane lipoprotein-sorting protein